MNELTYLAQSVGWSAVGFASGYLTACTAADVHRITTASPTETTVDSDIPSQRQHTHSLRWRPSPQWVLGIIVVILGIVTIVQGWVSNVETRRLTDCQTRYSNAVADALDARSRASSAAQDALDVLVTQLAPAVSGNAPATSEQRAQAHEAIDGYLNQRAATKVQLQANPLPPAPRTCE